MGRHTSRLTLDDLPELPGGCGSCAFWQLGPLQRLAGCADAEQKAGWVGEVLREWGSCGRVARYDGNIVGHVLYAPPVMVPGASGFPTSPASPDAVLLVSLSVAEHVRGGGIGRLLVREMARDLIKRGGIKAVEAFADTRADAGEHCLVPSDFLLSVGFRTLRAHARTPRMRMDLRTALSWREELESAFDRIRGVVPRPVATREIPSAEG